MAASTVITKVGESAIIRAGISGPQIKVASFRIGSSLIVPNENATDVADTVYIGVSSQIQYQILSESDFVYHILLDENIGNFNIGNIGLFLEDGTMLTITSLPGLVAKYRSEGTTTIGNYKAFDIHIKIDGQQAITDLTLLTVLESAIPEHITQDTMLPAAVAPYPLYLVRSHTLFSGRPTLAARVNGNWYYTFLTTDGILDMLDKRITNLGWPLATKDATSVEWIEHRLGLYNTSIVDYIQANLNALRQSILPVGSLYMNGWTEANPATYLGYGTWIQYSAARVLLGVGVTTDSRGDTRGVALGQVGGEFAHQVTIPELPVHGHPWQMTRISESSFQSNTTGGFPLGERGASTSAYAAWAGAAGSAAGRQIGGEGGNQAHNNVQPFIVAAIWLRSA